jgi:protein arginine N-methyltransferase 1
MANVVASAAARYLKIRDRLEHSSLLQGVKNANYFSSFELQEKMLADTRRVESYFQAIARYVKEGDVVVDLGTGTGILAFFAHARKPSKTYAIDHSSIIQHARTLASRNQMLGIEFVKTHSRSFRPPESVDVLVQEQMGSWIFNENMVDCVLDLRDRILKKGGRILPNRFEVFFEPAQLRRESVIPLIWEQRIHGIDFSCLEEAKESQRVATLMLQPHDIDCLLGEPEPIVTFDLESMKDASEIPGHWHSVRTALRPGLLNGFVLYFKAFFDEDTVVDTTPAGPYECLAQRRLPFYRATTVGVEAGDEITVELRPHDLTEPNSWSWNCSVGRGGGGLAVPE